MFKRNLIAKVITNIARSNYNRLPSLISLVFCAVFQFPAQTTPQNKQADYTVDQNLRGSSRVNPSTLAMELNIPLINYPGRAGNITTFGFTYSSKVWRMDDLFTYSYQLPYSCTRQSVTQLFPKYGERSIGGWTSTITPPIIEQRVDLYDANGKPIGNEFDEVFLPLALSSLRQGYSRFAENAVVNPNLPCGWYCAVFNVNWGECTRTEYNAWCNLQCSPGDACESNPGNGGGGCGGNPPPPPTLSYYVKRLHVRTSDGTAHELRKSDGIYGYCYATGNPNNGPNCNGNLADNFGSFLSVDGSGMRLERDANGSTLFMPNGSKFKFPAEEQHTGDNARMFFATEYQDVNGNSTIFSENVVDGRIFMAQKDTMERNIADPLPVNIGATQEIPEKAQTVLLPGLNGVNQKYILEWNYLKHPACVDSIDPNCEGGDGALENLGEKLFYQTNKLCFGGTETAIPGTDEFLFTVHGWGLRSCSPHRFETDANGNAYPVADRFNPVVLAGIKLPNGKSYTFKYNQYAEISKIIYPNGSFETFQYGVIIPLSRFIDGAYNQTNRGVTGHKIYRAGSSVPDQAFEYDVDPTGDLYKITTFGSKADNSTQLVRRNERYLIKGVGYGERFGFDSPLAGMPAEERSFDDNGNLRSRTLTQYTVTGPVPTGDQYNPARTEAQRDGRPLRSISITIEGNEALATMSENIYQDPATDSGVPSDPSYFAKLNVIEKRSYNYRSIPVAIARTGSFAAVAAYFNGAPLAAISQTDYSYDQAYYDRGIIGLPVETRVLNAANPSEVIAKSQIVYDQTLSPSDHSTFSIIDAGASLTWTDPGSHLRGNPTTKRAWVKETDSWLETHAQFDNFGNLRKAWDASGDPDKFVETDYDEDYNFAYPTKVIMPAPDPTGSHGTDQSSSVQTAYDLTTGLVLSVKDDFGQITATEYNDPLLRPTRVYGYNFTAPVSETIYDDTNLTVKVRKQLNETNWDEATTYADSLGRTIKTVAKDSQGDITVENHYDLLGRVDRVTNPYRAGDTVYWNKTRYDEVGRAVETYAPAAISDINANTNLVSLGTTSFGISTVSNYVGTVVTTSDASQRKGRSIANALGQLLRVDEPTAIGGTADADLGTIAAPAQPTYYTYDAYGHMVKVSQGVQNRYFKYDSLGRLIRINQPEQEINGNIWLEDTYNTSGQWTAAFTYDNLGNVVTATDAKHVTIANTYDRAGRVVARAYYGGDPPTSTPPVDFYYDGSETAETPPIYSKGKLTLVDNTISQTRYKLFDNFGRLKEMEQRTPLDGETTATAAPRVSKYTYNLSGALIEEEYPSGRIIKNELESDGDLSRVFGKANSSAPEQTYANSFSFTAAGGISRMRLGNGRWETAQFNQRNQVTQLGLGTSAADAHLWKTDYQYGELNSDGSVNTNKNTGNIAKQILTIPGASFTQSYKYDALYRLTEAKEVAGTSTSPNWTQTFGYDIYGNRTSLSQNIGGILTNTTPAVNPATNRFTSTNFTYDENGSITGDVDPVTGQVRQFVFNADNKQTTVKDANGNPIGRYYYDGEGNRVKKITNSETTVFVYSAGKLVAEYSTQVSTSPTISYTTTDHLGSPRVITDRFGNVRSRRDFMPFGEDIFAGIGGRNAGQKYSSNQDDIRQKFTGYQKDTETNLDFAEARMYENRSGRFTAVDPLLASGKSANPQTFNRYVYVGNSPLVITDPSGMIGDYYSQSGMYLGSDGKDDKKVYFAVQAGETKDKVILYTDSIKPTTIEEVLKIQDRNTTLTAGTEREAINSFGTNGVQGVSDVTNGVPKGIGNFFIDTANSLTNLFIHNAGPAPLPEFAPNPFEINRFTFSTWKEAMYGNAGYTATALAPTVAGAPFAASGAPSLVPELASPNGSFYSVAFETQIPNNLYPGAGVYRGSHFKAANVALDDAMASNPPFAKSMSDLGIAVPRSPTGNILGHSPKNWTWHHDINPGKLQLVPRVQHTRGSIFWNILHPNGIGGMSIWGR